jgi:hypothetical protein
MPLIRSYFVMLRLEDDRLSGRLYAFDPNTWESAASNAAFTFFNDVSLSASSRIYESNTDGLNNVIAYSDSFFYWFNLKGGFAPLSITLRNNNIDTTPDALITTALSGNKLALLYADRMDYYRLNDTETSGEGAIEKLFTRSYDAADTLASG